jgi:Tfp pilus assembly protein PilV
MGHTLKRTSGASLVEICLAVVIIAVTMLLILTFSRNTFSMSKDARTIDTAYQSAEKKLEELRADPFPAAGGPDTDIIDNITFTRNWDIVDSPYVRFAVVEVTYASLKGRERTITLAGALK